MFAMFGRNKRPAYEVNVPFEQQQIGYPYDSPIPGFDSSIRRIAPNHMMNMPMYWNPYSHNQQYLQAINPTHPSYGNYQNYANPYNGQQSYSHMIFQNPLQPKEESYFHPHSQQINPYPVANPYPKLQHMAKQPAGFQSIINSFKAQDGSVDFNKMINTAGQMMNAVNQVSSMVKGLGGMFKA
jgi:YppG-like protein